MQNFFKYLKYFLIFTFVLALVFQNSIVMSQEIQRQLTPQEERKSLEEELKKLEEELFKIEKDIQKTEIEKKTLKNQIYILKKKIEKLDIQIEQSDIMIKDISLQIRGTEASIKETSWKIDDSRQKLASILRSIWEEDQKSLIEILLSERTISGFFGNLAALETLNLKQRELLTEIKSLKSHLENQKQELDLEKTSLEKMLKMQLLQKQEDEKTKREKDYFLKLTESQYQKYLQEKKATQKKAAEIRARIFELIGVPKAPTFGEAYEIAKYVEKFTGIRPAFLLAILTQESNIGRNVGQCFLVDPKTGAGKKASGQEMKKVMNPTRDVPPFLQICKELGRDPYQTLVSCPMEYGWGGAMGPAQFIPSTWVLYKDRVEGITGKPADPWDIKDAFLASALYLTDCGAAKQTYEAEWKAAMIYFSGGTNARFKFYGDSVLKIAKGYEEDIKAIERVVKS